MSMRWIKVCTLTAVVAGAGSSFAADDKKPAEAKPAALTPAPAAAPAVTGVATGDCGTVASAPAAMAAGCGGCGSSAPAVSYQTVTVTEMVPTTVAETRTVMKPVVKAETYTAYKTEYVNEVQAKQVTVNKMVTETVNVTRNVQKQVTETVNVTKTISKKVPVTKTVMVNETHYENVSETKMVSKTVRHVDKVPTTVDLGPSILDRAKAFASPCYCPCPRSITVCKRQVSCETVCEPVTTCKKVPVTTCVPKTITTCETVCETVTVPTTVTKCVTVCETVPTTVTKCVPVVETQNVTVCVAKQVAYTATRNVCTTEAVTETVNVTKLVPTQVTKQVAVSTGNGGCGDAGLAAGNGCGSDACGPAFGGRIRGLLAKKHAFVQGLVGKVKSGFGGLFNRGCGCSTGCSAPAAPSCGGCN
jgi:hypothetical protein